MLIALIILPLLFSVGCRFADRRSDRARDRLALLGGALELALALAAALLLPDHTVTVFGIPLFALDGFRRVYTVVISAVWMATIIFSDEYLATNPRRGSYDVFTMLTLGLMMGEFLSASLSGGVLFLGGMSYTCYVWMKHELTPEARRMGRQFLRTATVGTISAVIGLVILYGLYGTTVFSRLPAAVAAGKTTWLHDLAGGLLLIGFGARAGMVPFHGWLTNAHPVPAPGSALLSGVVTKSGIWGILAMSCYLFRGDPIWGTAIVLFGTVTMTLGALLALLSSNLKRTLACSSISQIGFILVGIGAMELLRPLDASAAGFAANGVLLHMVNHSLFKLVLFLCAGVVVMRLHALELNDIRGFGRNKPMLLIAFLLGGLGIAGVPLTSGFISKTLLHDAIVESAALSGGWLTAVEWLFLLSGGMTLAYMGKLFVVLFVEKHPTRQAEFNEMRRYAKPHNKALIFLTALVIPALGCTANWTMDAVADIGTDFFHTDVLGFAAIYYTPETLEGAAISIGFGILLYAAVVRLIMRKNGSYRDCTGYRFREKSKN